jgi:hypothetical protein
VLLWFQAATDVCFRLRLNFVYSSWAYYIQSVQALRQTCKFFRPLSFSSTDICLRSFKPVLRVQLQRFSEHMPARRGHTTKQAFEGIYGHCPQLKYEGSFQLHLSFLYAGPGSDDRKVRVDYYGLIWQHRACSRHDSIGKRCSRWSPSDTGIYERR